MTAKVLHAAGRQFVPVCHFGKAQVFSHGGSDGTNAWVDPNNQLIVLLFTQSPGEARLHTRIFRLVQASIQ